MKRILVTGANGQIGSELVQVLRDRHGTDAVVGLDLHPPTKAETSAAETSASTLAETAAQGDGEPGHVGESDAHRDLSSGPFETGDVRDRDELARVIEAHDVECVYHLASLLSATGEKQPDRAWDVNLGGLKNVLDLAREHDLSVFWPSSIAVFGPSTPKEETPQKAVFDPATMYGVTKRSGELLCQYYHRRYDLDVRSLRYPGLISYGVPPGGGTTDYAVDMFYAAVRGESYTCFVRPDTRLPMMYMPDAIRATLDLMDAPSDALTVRDSYNVGAMSFRADALADAIQKHEPGFACTYAPDDRQQIADAWPSSVDDSAAREDWNWQPDYDLDAMTADMLAHLSEKESIAE